MAFSYSSYCNCIEIYDIPISDSVIMPLARQLNTRISFRLYFFHFQIYSSLLNNSLSIEEDCSKCILLKIRCLLSSKLFSEDIFTNIIVYRIHRQNEMSKNSKQQLYNNIFHRHFPNTLSLIRLKEQIMASIGACWESTCGLRPITQEDFRLNDFSTDVDTTCGMLSCVFRFRLSFQKRIWSNATCYLIFLDIANKKRKWPQQLYSQYT